MEEGSGTSIISMVVVVVCSKRLTTATTSKLGRQVRTIRLAARLLLLVACCLLLYGRYLLTETLIGGPPKSHCRFRSRSNARTVP